MKMHLFIVVMLVFSTMFVLVPLKNAPVAATDYSSWGLFRQCWVDQTNVDADLVNFPVLVSISDAIGDKCQSDGDDVRFTSSDNNTVYPHNIEKWVDGSNRLVWVRIPRVDDAANTTFWFHYNNPSVAGLTNWTDVWGVYNYVLHMNGTTTIQDYTANNHDGSSDADANTGGVVGSCQLFTKANSDNVNMGDHNDFTYTAGGDVDIAFTMSCWAKPTYTVTGSGQYFEYFGKDTASNREYDVWYYTITGSTYFEVYIFDSSISKYHRITTSTYLIPQTCFNLMTFTYNGNEKANGLDVYINGTKLVRTCTNDSSATYVGMENKASELWLGGQPYGGGASYYGGYMDEVRTMRGTAENASWIKAEFYSVSAPSTFVAVSGIERGTEIIPAVVPSAPVYFEARTQNSSWIQLNWTKGTGADKTVIIANDSGYPTLADCIVLYNGTLSMYNHTGLTNNTHWFYLCYSWNNTGAGCYNATGLRSHDTTMGISLVNVSMTNLNCTGSYTSEIGNRFVYQEDSDTATGGLITNAVDGIWTTYEENDGNSRTWILNYTAPSMCWNATWMVKDYNSLTSSIVYHNFSLNHSVVSQGYAKMKVETEWGDSGVVRYYVFYNGGYTQIYTDSDTSRFYEEAVTWYWYGYLVNFTAESQLNISTNLINAIETHFATWNTPFWDIVFNATGNTSGLVVVDNSVNTTGTNEYQWRPLLGVNGEWWVWVNQTGDLTPIHSFDNIINATGSHTIIQNSTGYWDWANYTGTGAAEANLTVINPNPGNGTHATNYLKKDVAGLTTSLDVTYINFTTPAALIPGTYSSSVASESRSNGACIWNGSVVYTDAWDNATGQPVPGPLYVGQYEMAGEYVITRSYLIFNTTSIPDEATITNAFVQLMVYDDHSATDFNVTIQEVKPPAPHSPLDPGDYNKGNFPPSATFGNKNVSGYVDDTWFNITVNASGLAKISKTGYTNWVLRSDQDIIASAPAVGDDEWQSYYAPGGVHPAYGPHLIINYTIPSSNWQHILNITFYNHSSGIPYNTTWVQSNGTVTVPAPMFNGVAAYEWNVTCESNHTNWFNSTVYYFETLASSGGSVYGGVNSRRNVFLLLGVSIGICIGIVLPANILRHRKRKEE